MLGRDICSISSRTFWQRTESGKFASPLKPPFHNGKSACRILIPTHSSIHSLNNIDNGNAT
ncbi:hypothetical protein CCM_08490 [Cordyceps militaris CM01]|uniref:Uncharacterized protein n=1 Tax=Cordyceps militaris (strain CM01) TaxID=983644 RepID=G3JRQ6_CORMM|nr:uncharacterized protein CCM_08490 [Cordyceps militaris CM01]EGX88446.1 hypothetical protein CCM_08490 [Cordyceps militaris CM01]